MTNTTLFSLWMVGALIIILCVLRLRRLSLQGVVFGVTGAILGLIISALASVPLSKLPDPLGGIAPVVASVVFTILTVALVWSQRPVLLALFPFLDLKQEDSGKVVAGASQMRKVLVDTSAIIDGRIADVARAGFVPGVLVVPRFVLAELQNIADSDDAMRRGRGRRGLETLNQLREQADVTVEITEEDAPEIREVDAKLVALAQRFGGDVLTTDYNLNRVAQIQGVKVLNVNELSNAIRPVVLPGEELLVRVVQPGKERNQGVGYLADGTMIVVENGDKMIGQEVATEVTRVFQTVAGKMIFATPRKPITPSRPDRQDKHDKAERQDKPGHTERAGRPEIHATDAVTAPLTPAPAAAPAPVEITGKATALAGNRPNGRGNRNNNTRRPHPAATDRPQQPATPAQAATTVVSRTTTEVPARPAPSKPRQRPQGGRHSGAIEDRLVRHNQGEAV
jgi:uncharacterized protein YacL